MTPDNPPATILVVSKNLEIIEATRSSLANESHLQLLEQHVTTKDLFSIINKAKPDIILLDSHFQDNPMGLVENMVSNFPESAVVAVLSQDELAQSDMIILSGARAFIIYPYQEGKLAHTLNRVVELTSRVQPSATEKSAPEEGQQAERTDNRTITVFSPKGGTGTTTIATNLAICLHKAAKEQVLLIDGKHLFGHVSLYLNLRSGNSINDLITHASMLDQQLIDQVAVKHSSGINVLPSPNKISLAQDIRPDALFNVLQVLKAVYPYIVIDGGNHLDENTVTYLDSSDKILLALNPNLASMRDVRIFLEISDSLSYPRDKSLLLVNLAGHKAEIRHNEIEKIIKLPIFGTISADENLALSSLNDGVPILLKKPHHRISREYKKITKNLLKTFQAGLS